jgi:hypothetical protein
MVSLPRDTELEYEIQELYILAKNWLQDISFAEDELHFFRNLLHKYQVDTSGMIPTTREIAFSDKIILQEKNIADLKIAVPQFMKYLEPYIGNLKKAMDLDLLDKYNGLDDQIQSLFAAVRATKKDLFDYAETVIDAGRAK